LFVLPEAAPALDFGGSGDAHNILDAMTTPEDALALCPNLDF
jgi:hypothetical protein